jgi:hypothetical protein
VHIFYFLVLNSNIILRIINQVINQFCFKSRLGNTLEKLVLRTLILDFEFKHNFTYYKSSNRSFLFQIKTEWYTKKSVYVDVLEIIATLNYNFCMALKMIWEYRIITSFKRITNFKNLMKISKKITSFKNTK